MNAKLKEAARAMAWAYLESLGPGTAALGNPALPGRIFRLACKQLLAEQAQPLPPEALRAIEDGVNDAILEALERHLMDLDF